MKRNLCIVLIVVALCAAGARPAAGQTQNRYIVRTTGGLTSVLRLCLSAGCQVQGSLDGPIGQTYLVTSSGNLIANLLNPAGSLLESLLGIVSIEPDHVWPLPVAAVHTIPAGLYDTAPVNYFGTVVTHGYAAQPAAQIIRLTDAQRGFNVSGSGVVAVIDTGVDVNHPVLYPVLLHDIGKVGIPDAILRKPSKLDNDEYALMKKHPEYGWAVLRVLPGFERAALDILHHHEAVDGTGYPAGLQHNEIPIVSRIVSVIDAFDAMISSRPYRKGLPYEEGVRRLLQASGTQFDANVVKCFLSFAEADIDTVFAAAGTSVSSAL